MGQEKYLLHENFDGISFSEFAGRVEQLLPVRFFYKEEWIRDLRVGMKVSCSSLYCYLDHIFSGTSLYYFIEDNGNIIITKDFAIRDPDRPGEGLNYLQSELNGAGSKSEDYKQVEVGNPSEKNKSGHVTLSGYIINEDTHEPLPGVTVYIIKQSTGVISNEFGYYHISLPRGSHLVQFSSIGLKPKQVEVALYGSGEMNIEMKSAITPLKEVIIKAEKSQTLQQFEVGAERINLSGFKLLPTTMGESDIFKGILLIPGVQSIGEGSSGFNVRGGYADQNLILLNDAPVYNSNHFFGFFSAINPDVIRDVTLYKGGIPARYGGRISSVLDIGLKDGSRNKFRGMAGISPITTHLMLEGPLIKDTLYYIIAARTTYSNWIFKLVRDSTISRSRVSFYDLNGKLSWDVNKNNRIDVSGYFSHDRFKFNSDTLYYFNHQIYTLKWRHFFSSRLFMNADFNTSRYEYRMGCDEIPVESFVLSHNVNSSGYKVDFNWFPGKHEINAGFDLTRYSISPGIYAPNHDSSAVLYRSIEKEHAFEGAVYAEEKYTLSRLLSVQIGFRVSSFFALGPQSVMAYRPGYSKSEAVITDTLFFADNKVIKRYGGIEPRISLNFHVSDNTSIKINYNRTRQYLHMISNSMTISPTDTWKLSDYYLKPQIGDQLAAGYYKVFLNNLYEFSAEAYYKRIANMIDYKSGTNLVMDDPVEKDLVNVRGRAFGIEMTFKKTQGKIRYNIGYTYARVFVQSTGTLKEEKINAGHWFPANFDKPHNLNLSGNYLLSRRFSFSANYTWSTGRPITFPESTYILYDNKLVHYSNRNEYRIRDYARLDLSFNINANLKSHKLARPVWSFSLYNALGRRNVYSVYFKKEGEIVKGYQLSVFGRAIPTITYNFTF